MSILGVAEKIKKRRGKYNMTENKNKLESRGVSLTNAQWERCDKLAEQLGKKSRNTFIREAVDFYCAWLEKEHIEKFLLPSLESVLTAKIRDSESRIRNVEFKLAVQIAMLTQMLTDNYQYSDDELEALRESAVRQVKETNGSFRY